VFVSSVYGICKVFLNFPLLTNYSNKLQALKPTGLCGINKTVHIMTSVVMILHVVSVLESGKCVLFWIMYNNYSMKALLNFIQVVFINHQKIIIAKLLVKRQLSHDCFDLNGSQELLLFHTTYHFLLQRVSCHSNGTVTYFTYASLF